MRRDGGWTDRYWDILDQLYWSPQYLGLKSIPQSQWNIDRKTVSVPIDLVNRSGPLYRRARKWREYWVYVQRQEESLNHVLNLALGILPGVVLSELLLEPAGAAPDPEISGIGREVRTRLGWKPTDNIAQPDGFFISETTVLCLEIKLGARTTLDQVVKYACLMAAEQRLHGRRDQLRLVYLTPDGTLERLEKQIGMPLESLQRLPVARAAGACGNRLVSRFIASHTEAFEDTLRRMLLHAASWRDVRAAMARSMSGLGNGKGDLTLLRLLSGLDALLQNHPLAHAANPDRPHPTIPSN